MAVADISEWWIIGWGVGFGGAVIAALLLLFIIRTGAKIASQADEIRTAIERSHANTEAMFDLPRVNLALDKLVRGLRSFRGAAR